MLNMKEYMKKIGVTKAKYVEEWIKRDLIPGITKGEFESYIRDLEGAGLISVRIEDGIVYYDSTLKSDAYSGWNLGEIMRFVCTALELTSKLVTVAAPFAC